MRLGYRGGERQIDPVKLGATAISNAVKRAGGNFAFYALDDTTKQKMIDEEYQRLSGGQQTPPFPTDNSGGVGLDSLPNGWIFR